MKERRQTGVYASCTYHQTSLNKLAKWMVEHEDLIQAPVPLEQIHTTVIYSRKDFDCQVLGKSIKATDPQWLWPSGFALLGKPEDEKACLVMLLDAGSLVNIHNFFVEHGAEHDYDDYIPHITLSYDVPKDFDLSSLTLPDFCFIPNEIKFEPLNLNWSLQSAESVL